MRSSILMLGLAALLASAVQGCSSTDLTGDCVALCQAEQAAKCATATSGDCASEACSAAAIKAIQDTGCADQLDKAYRCAIADPSVCKPTTCTAPGLDALSCVESYCASNSSSVACASSTSH